MGNLRLEQIPVEMNPVVQDCLRLCALTACARARVVIFYPFSLIEILVLAALECLYQSNYKKDCPRHGALLVTDSKQRTLEYYLGLRLAYSPLWRLFGKADGSKQSETKTHSKSRVKMTFEKKLEVVSPGRLSHVEDLEKFSVIILGVRTTWGLGKVSETMTYARRGGIPTFLVFEPWHHIRKARLYNELLFHIYGWSNAELDGLHPNSSVGNPEVYNQSGPESVPSTAEMPKTTIEVLPRDSCSDLFESLTPLIHSLFLSEPIRGYAGTVYGISRDLLRLAVPLKSYDFECLGSFFKTPIADRVKRLEEQIDRIPEEQATGSLRKARLLLSDLCDRLGAESNQKYEVMLQRLRGTLVNRTPAALIFSNVQERTAFEKSLSALETPIPLDLPSQMGVLIGSYDSLPHALAGKKLKEAIFSTYPPLGRTDQVADWLLAHCETSTLILRKPEAEAFRFYQNDAENLRIFLFSPSARNKTLTDLALGKPATRLAIPRTGTVEVQEPSMEPAPSYSHKDLLKLLIEFDEAGIIPTAPQHPASAAKESATTLPGLLVHFAEGGTLALKRSKYVYKYMEEGKVKPVRSERLKPGDVLVLVDM